MVTITDVKCWPVKKENKWILANCQFTVDGAFVLKATLSKGQNGPWLSFPGKLAEKPDANGKKPFYADIKCVDKEVSAKLFQQVMAEYNKATGKGELDQTPSNENMNQTSQETIPF